MFVYRAASYCNGHFNVGTGVARGARSGPPAGNLVVVVLYFQNTDQNHP